MQATEWFAPGRALDQNLKQAGELSDIESNKSSSALPGARWNWAVIRWYAQSGKPPATLRRPSGRKSPFPQPRPVICFDLKFKTVKTYRQKKELHSSRKASIVFKVLKLSASIHVKNNTSALSACPVFPPECHASRKAQVSPSGEYLG
jgi:hypothetical protein